MYVLLQYKLFMFEKQNKKLNKSFCNEDTTANKTKFMPQEVYFY